MEELGYLQDLLPIPIYKQGYLIQLPTNSSLVLISLRPRHLFKDLATLLHPASLRLYASNLWSL
jgi:hypothetical protein